MTTASPEASPSTVVRPGRTAREARAALAPRVLEADIVVVGARCAGAATAMLLARAGHDVLVLDRATFPSDTISTHVMARPGEQHRRGGASTSGTDDDDVGLEDAGGVGESGGAGGAGGAVGFG